MSKPNSNDTHDQSASEDNQNFDIDINELFNQWIVPIDKLRSLVSINAASENILRLLSKSDKSDIDITSVSSLTKIETKVQESRCHTFYRWIGFPVSDKGMDNIYNPGFDIIKSQNAIIKLADKINRASNPMDGFNALSDKRESFCRDNLDIFADNASLNASVLALSCGTEKVRRFIVPFESGATLFDMNVDNQSFEVNLTTKVGENEININQFQDSNGNTPTKPVKSKRPHIIRPFIVDARIDFSVSPQYNLIAVPFVPDSNYTKVDEVNNVEMPLIEKFIRSRFANSQTSTETGSSVKNYLQITADFPDIKDNELIQLANDENSVLQPSDKAELIKSINIIKSMMQKLIDAQNKIGQVQENYYWVPRPSTSGPEGGCTVQGVFFPTVISSALITPKDIEVFKASAAVASASVNSQGAAASGNPDKGGFALPSYKVTFGPDTTTALGDNASQNLETISQRRKNALSEAGDALRTIEIIMGDLSGLGLCDIVAIISSLNIIPKENLLGFLDANALARAKAAMPTLNGVTPIKYSDAMIALSDKVKEYYNLMDKIYLDILNNKSTS